MKTPILFLIFNRPDTTQQVFNAIRQQQPPYLFVAADGPRPGKTGERELCEKTRAIIRQVDWQCEVKTLYRSDNLGCGKAVSSAISWFFEHVEQGIILEDDCLPNPTFFTFCEQLLEKHKDNEQVMHIGGNNFQNGIRRGEGSYYFSNYSHIWGWATWRRAWQHYDYNMKEYKEFKKSKQIRKLFRNLRQRCGALKTIARAYRQRYNTWDYQWTFGIWNAHGVSIIPNVNLVSNIGFGANATHTNSIDNRAESISSKSIALPLAHPTTTEVNAEADLYYYTHFIYQPLLLKIKIFLHKNIYSR